MRRFVRRPSSFPNFNGFNKIDAIGLRPTLLVRQVKLAEQRNSSQVESIQGSLRECNGVESYQEGSDI